MPSPEEVGLNIRFDHKTGGALVKLRRPFLHFRRRRRQNYSIGGGAARRDRR